MFAAHIPNIDLNDDKTKKSLKSVLEYSHKYQKDSLIKDQHGGECNLQTTFVSMFVDFRRKMYDQLKQHYGLQGDSFPKVEIEIEDKSIIL